MKLGEAAIAAIRDFASSKVPTTTELEKDMFVHVRDRRLRKSLAETLHGARWVYHLGLVTLATDVHRAAHVRAQIIDYAAICEAVLIDTLTHGIFHSHLSGTKWRRKMARDRTWYEAEAWPSSKGRISRTMRKGRNFYWLIEVAAQERVIKPGLKNELHTLRDQRNAVHIAELAAVGETAGINVSKDAYRIMHSCVEATKDWMTLHP